MTRIKVIVISISILTALLLIFSSLLAAPGPGVFSVTLCDVSDTTQYTLLNPNPSPLTSVHQYYDQIGNVAGGALNSTPAGGTDMYTIGDYVPAGYEGYAIINSDFPFSITIDAGPGAPLMASFEADPLIGNAPQTVVFTNTSSGFDTSLWEFGDGVTSTLESPTYTYSISGTYAVTLTVSHSGCLVNQPQLNPSASAVIQISGSPKVFMPVVLNP